MCNSPQEFAKLIVRADVTPAAHCASIVYCALDSGRLLGVFSDKEAATICASGVEKGTVQAQVVRKSYPQDEKEENLPSEPENAERSTGCSKPLLLAATVPVPAVGPGDKKDVV